jgi:hypothetical protein
MKMRIVQKPSLTNNPDIFWYHAQVRRLGIWVNCRDDLFMMLKYSSDMMVQSWDTNIERVESFVEHAMRGEEMFPKTKNKVVKEYHA